MVRLLLSLSFRQNWLSYKTSVSTRGCGFSAGEVIINIQGGIPRSPGTHFNRASMVHRMKRHESGYRIEIQALEYAVCEPQYSSEAYDRSECKVIELGRSLIHM